MFLNVILIIYVSGCLGHTNRKHYEDGNLSQQLDYVVTFVNEKIEGMETLLKLKDDCVDQLKLDLAHKKTRETKLTQRIASLERALLEKGDREDQLKSYLDHQKTETTRLTQRMASLERALLAKEESEDQFKSDLDREKTETTRLTQRMASLERNLLQKDETVDRLVKTLSELQKIAHANQHVIEVSTQYSNGSRLEKVDDANEKDKMFVTKAQFRQNRVAPPSQAPKTTVAFHVTLSGASGAYTNDAIVVYGHVALDQGSGYNPVDGIYITPESGTYVLTWTTICEKHNFFQTVLVVNGSIRGSSWTESADVDDYHQTTAVVILHLSQGDHVFIRMGHTYGQGTIVNYSTVGSSTFSGWKLD